MRTKIRVNVRRTELPERVQVARYGVITDNDLPMEKIFFLNNMKLFSYPKFLIIMIIFVSIFLKHVCFRQQTIYI